MLVREGLLDLDELSSLPVHGVLQVYPLEATVEDHALQDGNAAEIAFHSVARAG